MHGGTIVIRSKLKLVGFWSIAFGTCVSLAHGQAQLADDIVIISKGQRAVEEGKARIQSNASGVFGFSPGGQESRLAPRKARRGPVSNATATRNDVLSVLSSPTGAAVPQLQEGRAIEVPSPKEADMPLYGSLDIPEADDEGPPNGLSIEQAIDRLIAENPDLQSKAQELPKAEADVLTAGLRGNPLVFASADDVPYGNYNVQRPGEKNYAVTVIQPFDVNKKRKHRTSAAESAMRVVEAQFQDAVRLEIEVLYANFIDVLAARETIRYAETSAQGLDELLEALKAGRDRSQVATNDVDRVAVLKQSAELGRREAAATLEQAKIELAALLFIPAEELSTFDVRGQLRMAEVLTPGVKELVAMAPMRPDVVAYRLGVERAIAEVAVERAECFPDVFVLYTPYGYRDNSAVQEKSASSWGLSAMASVPIFNRNQGRIKRAKLSVTQAHLDLAFMERTVQTEIRKAHTEFDVSRSIVTTLEKEVIPTATLVRDRSLTLFKSGQEGILVYLNAQRDYNEIVRRYRDALVRQQRAAMKLNTAVGARIIR